MNPLGRFSPGNLVALASDRAKRCAVIGIQPGEHDKALLDHRHHALWQAANTAHREREQANIAYRKESLAGSHRARIALFQEQLAQTDDANIRRMRQVQLDTAENDFKQRIADLDAASARADILATPVVFGCIRIRQGKTPEVVLN